MGLFDVRFLAVHVSTAAVEEVVRQIRSSAGAPGAASHGHWQKNFPSCFGLALMI